MKRIKESLYEKFTRESDPIKDLQIGGAISDETFEEMKKEILQQLKDFESKYDEYTKYVSPKYWRTTGKHVYHIKSMQSDLERINEHITLEDLKNPDIRNESGLITDDVADFDHTDDPYAL